MLQGSLQTGLHEPIIRYLEDRNVKINLGQSCRDIVHEVYDERRLTRVTGIKVSPSGELKEFDVVISTAVSPNTRISML